MSAEQYFKDMELHLVIGLHYYGREGPRWWGKLEKEINGIRVTVEQYSVSISTLLDLLETAWRVKTEILPPVFSVPKQLAAPIEDAAYRSIDDEIPF